MNYMDFDDSFEVITVENPQTDVRVDTLLSVHTGLSRSRIVSLIERGYVFCNENPVKKSAKSTGEPLTVFLPPPVDLQVAPENIPLDIYFEDEHLLVVNKPQGMVVHPAAGNYEHTLVNALLYHCKDSLSGIGGVLRPGIVHRIDKDTSGLLIVAKTDKSHFALSEQIRTHDFSRKYRAILWGTPKDAEGKIEGAIGRSKTDRKKMADYPLNTPNTKNALTEYRVLESFRRFSYAEFTLHTGRTHQIRVHAKKIGHPIVGDEVYASGRDTFGQAGQLLHAAHIAFTHPITQKTLTFDAPIPCHMAEFLEKLKRNPHEAL